MVNIKTGHIRSSKEFKQLIAKIKQDFIIKGKVPPTTEQITKAIAKKIGEGDIHFDKYIEFK